MVKFIKEFNISVDSINYNGENRSFTVIGDAGAKFELEVKNSTLYYDFRTRSLTSTRKVLTVVMDRERYQKSINFPSVFSQEKSSDTYTLTLTAISDDCATTQHVSYVEVRDTDGDYIGPINENSSIGSSGVSLKKTIPQSAAQTISLYPYGSDDPTAWPTFSAIILGTASPRGSFKSNFTITVTADAKEAVRIDRQPTQDDFFYATATAVSATLPIDGQDVFDGKARSTDTTDAVISGTLVTMKTNVADKMAPGDKVTGTGISDTAVVTVSNITDGTAKQFRASESVSIADDIELTFTPPRNYRFPVADITNIRAGMRISPALNGGGSIVGGYARSRTIQQYLKKECSFELVDKSITLASVPAIEATGIPTFSNGKISSQAGNICFQEPIGAEFTAASYSFQGYGIKMIEDLTGFGSLSFTNLKAEILDANVITTTISDASANNISSLSDFDVANKDGIMNNVSRVKGVNFDTSTGVDPLVTTIGSSTNTNITVTPGGHILQNGQAVEFTGAAKIITITGNVEIKDIGFNSQNLYLDVGRFLTIASNA
jgi:hypothetical protein